MVRYLKIPGLALEQAEDRRKRAANLRRYDVELCALEISPNGDDYSALIEMLNGAPYRSPSVTGR